MQMVERFEFLCHVTCTSVHMWPSVLVCTTYLSEISCTLFPYSQRNLFFAGITLNLQNVNSNCCKSGSSTSKGKFWELRHFWSIDYYLFTVYRIIISQWNYHLSFLKIGVASMELLQVLNFYTLHTFYRFLVLTLLTKKF